VSDEACAFRGDPDHREKSRGDVPGDNPKRQRGREGGRQGRGDRQKGGVRVRIWTECRVWGKGGGAGPRDPPVRQVSMKSVFTAICQAATPEQIDTYIASKRIVETSWVPPTTGTYNARLHELLAKCKNKADGGVEFALSESSGSGSGAPANNGEAVCQGHGY